MRRTSSVRIWSAVFSVRSIRATVALIPGLVVFPASELGPSEREQTFTRFDGSSRTALLSGCHENDVNP